MTASSVTRRRKSCPVVEDPTGVSTCAFFDGLSFPRFKRDDLRVRTAAASKFPLLPDAFACFPLPPFVDLELLCNDPSRETSSASMISLSEVIRESYLHLA